MNRVIYVFKDGTRVTSYAKAQAMKADKGDYSVEYEWVDIKETEENLSFKNTKSSKPVRSRDKK